MAKSIYQIQVALVGSKPKIWRRVLIPSDMPLSDVHKVIQTAMGWANSHLHQFVKGKKYYAPVVEDDDSWDDTDSIDYKDILVSDLLKAVKDKMEYEYDFGDGWEHTVELEAILPVDESAVYPFCVDGKMNCPVEDSGGVGGYQHMLAVLKDTAHEEYAEYMEWLGGDLDPTYFEKDEINEMFRMTDYGCLDMSF
ncbi:plasmid pRiA4b ORF-3 family protein [Williamwhitmania taraxaci]|uniref:PRiA4b ORF-3-like protein n=1 Tax=Williamwhitmania taraxaci TaxID=1640674 RepID=A0A1G6I5J0_9BACT|nr:plasmid pRiA4b ORF-3 family protein [Williamwhitmania taraxaci]SDC01305.1 pRiA4b ORF-3-like protein [Williamwhitmania taraxaci]